MNKETFLQAIDVAKTSNNEGMRHEYMLNALIEYVLDADGASAEELKATVLAIVAEALTPLRERIEEIAAIADAQPAGNRPAQPKPRPRPASRQVGG